MERLLLVEDDKSLAMAIEFTLKDEGYEIVTAQTIESGKKLIDKQYFNLLILDVNLPDGNGYELCKYVRGKSNVPIMFLTALADEVNVVLGLEIGGDDYITKPFRLKEFIARVKALLRRNSNVIPEKIILNSGNITVDTSTATVKKNEIEITLTAQEYRLLLIFMTNPQRLIKREEILKELIEKSEVFFDENTLSVYIKRMREKIEDNYKEPQYIITQRGFGYRWNQDVIRNGI